MARMSWVTRYRKWPAEGPIIAVMRIVNIVSGKTGKDWNGRFGLPDGQDSRITLHRGVTG